MKSAIFGDIHANLEALTAVLADADEQGCTRNFCTGDIVGYNANPQECTDIIRGLDCPAVQGNHDEVATNDVPLFRFNPVAAKAIKWTRQHLSDNAKRWLSELPMCHVDGDITIVHATLDHPEQWGYVLNNSHARASLALQHTPVTFIGHTHQPRIYIQRDRPVEMSYDLVIKLEPSTKYLINVGSVGLSRDGDQRASYATYDQDKQIVELRRVDYDSGESNRKAIEAGLK